MNIQKIIDTDGIDAVFDSLLDYFDYIKSKQGDSVELQLAIHHLKKCESHILRELYFGGNHGKDV